MNHASVVPEPAGPADVPSLAVTFAAAFRDDAMIRWPMPAATLAMQRERAPEGGPVIWFMQVPPTPAP